MPSATRRPIPAAIAVVIKDNAVLLVRRANPPDAGLWGFPGGKIDFGESVLDAATRELFEETAIRGEAFRPFAALDAFDRRASGEIREHYLLIAVLCQWVSGTPRAGDDALEAAWHPLRELGSVVSSLSAGVLEIASQAFQHLHHAEDSKPV